ncbi:MAG: DNA (cytosine-5-)-methyltransferase [Deltaproteobacteria bacterium]|nr:DNA (cytosine-5-)-methyltransferase [Deltaproteobacteria bacterium]
MSQKEFLLSILREAKGDRNQPDLFESGRNLAAPAAVYTPFTFIDLFAGIGGFHIGLGCIGGRCLYSCEWDKHAQKTYKAWFGEVPVGDIREVDPKSIPDHDLLAAGFPCQPFSIAGVSKKKSLGREHGFKDKTQGTLFFHIASIIEVKRPPVVILENVKNLLSHDKKRTWQTIKATLEELDYVVFHKVIDASGWVPQHRERIFIVCFDKQVFGANPPFQFPDPPKSEQQKFRSILERKPDSKYTLSDHLWDYLQRYAESHKAKGNGFGFGLTDLDGISRTLSARYYKDGSEVLIPQKGNNPRRLTPREAARLMGFEDSLDIVVSDTQAYRQFGNAVVPKVVEAVGQQVVQVLKWQLQQRGNGCLLKRS